ncbi:MAG: translational GTPase TypA [Proteobacteria bacterium]|nr:translational GTPase TypA [Pseudomonadota bacterium]
MELRNIAMIAHVDHGKTTLIDQLLRQSGAFRAGQTVGERALDSNELERERGITIVSKCTSVLWGEIRINIVDTPGHGDFGGEVERILGMVDGVALLVDAAEGPMPQTKFVLAKALALGLRPFVVINKMDRPDARPIEVQDAVFDLFAALDASEAQLDFPTLFASAKEGWAVTDPEAERRDMSPFFELVKEHVGPPAVKSEAPFAMLVTIQEADLYLGRVLTGRISQGSVRPNTSLKALGRDGRLVEEARVTKLLAFRGLDRVPVEEARAGDIVALAGFALASVSDTLGAPSLSAPIPARPVDPPTITMTFSVNDSPLAGREGTKVTSRMLRERLFREAESNVAIQVAGTDEEGAFEISGRGELQLGVLIETMRREGFELSVGPPRVIFRADPETGERLEPIEEVVIDVDEGFAGVVVDKLSGRKGEMSEMRPSGKGRTRMSFLVPARGLVGYHSEFLTDTRGTGVVYRVHHGYAPYRGAIIRRRNGVLIATAQGAAVPYALYNLEGRGPLFVEPGAKVYRGMIVGEHARGNDLDVNPLRTKQLTNIRAAGKDEAVVLTQPVRFSLEQAIAYIDDDELVEVTPKTFRLRKRLLGINDRKRAARAKAAG